MKYWKGIPAAVLALFMLLMLAGCVHQGASREASSSAAVEGSETVSSSAAEQSSETASPSKPEQGGETTSSSRQSEKTTTPDTADTSVPDGKIRIRLRCESGETIAALEDNPTTQSLLSQLPATVTFDDYAGSEKIAYFPQDLSTQGAPDGYDPAKGDVACYGPWGNLVFYYQEASYADGIIHMGRVESGLEALSSMGAGFEVTVEQID